MLILKTLKPIRMNNKMVEPGGTIKIENAQGLIEKGYARELTKEETNEILCEYVKYAEELFSEAPVRKTTSSNRKNAGQERLL